MKSIIFMTEAEAIAAGKTSLLDSIVQILGRFFIVVGVLAFIIGIVFLIAFLIWERNHRE